MYKLTLMRDLGKYMGSMKFVYFEVDLTVWGGGGSDPPGWWLSVRLTTPIRKKKNVIMLPSHIKHRIRIYGLNIGRQFRRLIHLAIFELGS